MRACTLCYCLSLSFEINPRPFGLFVCNIQHTVWICQRFWFLPMQRKFTATCQLFGKVFGSCSFWNNSKEAVLVIPNHLGWWTSWTSSLKKAEVSAMMARNQSMNWTKYLDSPKKLLHKLESHWLVNPKNPFVTSPPPPQVTDGHHSSFKPIHRWINHCRQQNFDVRLRSKGDLRELKWMVGYGAPRNGRVMGPYL